MADLTIPEYTAQDYIETSKPYKWLYDHRDDKFLMAQLKEKMKRIAGSLGVRSFCTMFDLYCESVAAENRTILENSTEFDGQAVELLCGEYTCNNKGVTIQDKYGYTQTICTHPILPVRRIINIDTGEERLEIAYRKGRGKNGKMPNWRSIIVEKSVIASSSQILQLSTYGVVVNSENAKELSTYLLNIEDLNYDLITEQKSVGRLGWVLANGFSPYYSDLIFDGEADYRHIFNSVRSEGSRQEWLDAMIKFRAERTQGRLFLAASFASVILEPCGLLPFFLHAWGGSGNGKSVGLMVAASVWASPKVGDYITTFNSTDVGQEKIAGFLNSLPMCMDELQILSASGVTDFDRIIYKLCEGAGKIRGTKTGGIQKISTWRNCFITSGERPITNSNSGGGTFSRVIEFESEEKIYSDLIWLYGVVNRNFGFAGREFIEYLQSDGNYEAVNSLQKEYYRQLLNHHINEKQAGSAAAILAADHIATDLLFRDGNELTVADMEKICKTTEETDVNARALDFVRELIARNPMHFKANDFGEYKYEVWGRIDDDYIYIAKNVLKREMQAEGFNISAFLSWAKRNGMLVCDKDGRRTRKAQIAGQVINTVCLLRDPDAAAANIDDDFEDIPL